MYHAKFNIKCLHQPFTLLDLRSFVLQYEVGHLLKQTFTSLILQLVEKGIPVKILKWKKNYTADPVIIYNQDG